MDAIMLGSSIPRRSWFLARSDVFRKKWLANFLTFIGIVPIYRLLEGAENLQKNDETFEKCNKMLEQKKAIMIFSEGLCIQERRLRKLKKGTARIAFGSEEKNDFNLDCWIVPVGLNYSSTPWKFRSRLYIEFGDPFPMSDYKELYLQDKSRAMTIFTRDLEARMKKCLVIIDRKENDDLVNKLEEMLLEDWSEEAGLDAKDQKATHPITKKIANVVNTADQSGPERVRALDEKVKAYFSSLKDLGLRDWLLRPKNVERMGLAIMLLDFLFFFLLFPFWIFGVITNYLPYKIPYLVANKVVRNVEFHASINGTLSVFLFQIFWGLECLAVALIFRDWWILGAFAVAMPLCGLIAQEYWVRMKKSKGKANLLKAFRSDRKKIEALIHLRAEIVSEMELLKNSYAESVSASAN